jgi:hypothetical protein
MIADAAAKYGVSPPLALEVATVESNLKQSAVSSAGAIGVFQLMPATAASLGVDPTNLAQNIDGGVRYLAQLLGRFSDLAAALGAYDWGPTNVSKAIAQYGANWLAAAPAETQNYVQKILNGLGTQYTVSAPVPPPPIDTTIPTDGSVDTSGIDTSVMDPSLLVDLTSSAAPSFTTVLILGALGLLALYLVEG